MKKLILSAITGGSIAGLSLVANAQVTVVPGTSNPYLAGLPGGVNDTYDGDTTPQESPDYAGSVTAGSTVTWGATGLVNNGPGYLFEGPNGDTTYSLFGPVTHPSLYNTSGLDNVPEDALVGVFLGPGAPASIPSDLDYSSLPLTYSDFTPQLAQVFYMGNGSMQSLVVPAGATRLFLGTVDGFGWNNNAGAFLVDFTQGVDVAVPDAGTTLAMLGAAFGMLGVARRKIG